MPLQKKYFITAMIFFAALIGATAFFNTRTLQFSAPSGFYEGEFELSILGDKRHQIYYTLDGSTPTTDSIPYTGPIRITDATENENVYSSLTTLSAGFFEEEITEHGYGDTIPGYRVPDFKVDKCTVIRAAAFDGEHCVESVIGSYFVGFEEWDTVENVRVVSVVTDPENLFDEETGIYVTGVLTEQHLENLAPGEIDGWQVWPANYNVRGKETERPVHVEVFETDRTQILSTAAGIRIQGGYSRCYLPRGLSLYSRMEYSGSESFQAPELFGEDLLPHKFILYSGGQDNKFKVNDYLAQNISKDLNFATMDFYPCVLFLNGEFWGFYHMTEHYNGKYVQDHYGVPEDDVIIWKVREIVEGEPHELELYQEMRDYISSADMTVEENYQRAQELIDLDNFIDYFATQIYTARYADWPTDNIAAWRSRSVQPNSEYRDGRWRWMLYDLNSGTFFLNQLDADTLAITIEKEPILASLCKNSDFRARFSQRLYDIGETVYTPERFNGILDDYLEKYTTVINASNKRFYGVEHTDAFYARVENLRTFLTQRGQYVDMMIKNNFGEEYVR